MNKYCLLFATLLLCSCRVTEQPIAYGSDGCEHCRMTIIDKRYGSEIVTSKGKIYTFDSVECLIEFLSDDENSGLQAGKLLVTSYTEPDNLIDANTAVFLISEELPSPMGAYITAFGDKKVAKEFSTSRGGYLYNWEELLMNFRQIKK